jgi:hypothetical protein
VLLDIDEVAQGELELVHSVDEREVDRQSAQIARDVVIAEVVVAGRGADRDVRAERRADAGLGVDSDRACLGVHERERLAFVDADLQVRPRPHTGVDRREQLEVVRPRKQDARQNVYGEIHPRRERQRSFDAAPRGDNVAEFQVRDAPVDMGIGDVGAERARGLELQERFPEAAGLERDPAEVLMRLGAARIGAQRARKMLRSRGVVAALESSDACLEGGSSDLRVPVHGDCKSLAYPRAVLSQLRVVCANP